MWDAYCMYALLPQAIFTNTKTYVSILTLFCCNSLLVNSTLKMKLGCIYIFVHGAEEPTENTKNELIVYTQKVLIMSFSKLLICHTGIQSNVLIRSMTNLN